MSRFLAGFAAWLVGAYVAGAASPPVNAGEVQHWAFEPVTRPAVPGVQNQAWLRNDVDAFIAAKHEAQGLAPADEAPRRVLIRRLYLDLLGLPPTPEQVERFVADAAPDAYERLVERVLASPHYGERWGRHWLDVARWAESEGYESNHLRPYAWRYRDYVVAAFRDDKPYDEFVRQQIAGDELAPYSDENLIATGFLAAARLSSNEEDKWRQRNDVLVDIVNTTGSALLGLTIGCAQCHDHKLEPLTMRDYYGLQGYFAQGQPANLGLKDAQLRSAYEGARPAEYEPVKKLRDVLFEGARARLIAEARKAFSAEELAAFDKPADVRSWEEERIARRVSLKFQFTPNRIEKAIEEDDRKLYEELTKKIAAMEEHMPDVPQTFGFYSPVTSPTDVDVLPMKGFYPLPYEPEELGRARPYVLVRGDVHDRGARVQPGWPAVLGQVRSSGAGQGTRAALADWLTDEHNPLTARVWVNRLWHYHFGRGLVATPGDFGVNGATPTHPELLDWLASELMRSGWSTKHVQRLIVCSATYRQSSHGKPAGQSVDPENRYWWRWMPRRLEAEAIRDSLLAVSGELDRTVGGPSVPPEEQGQSNRRTLYMQQKRDAPPVAQALFDGPAAVTESCSRRHVSTVAQQPLYLLNSDFVYERAKAFAARVVQRAGEDRIDQVEQAFRLALGRVPDATERAAAEEFFASHQGSSEPTDGAAARALTHLCQALLNLNEFVYIE